MEFMRNLRNLHKAGIDSLNADDDYRKTHTFEKRRNASAAVRRAHPDRVPVVCQRSAESALEPAKKSRYLVPRTLTVQQFLFIVRKHAKLTPEQAIFLFTANKTLASGSTTIGELDENMRNEDGFVYIFYTDENTFGAAT